MATAQDWTQAEIELIVADYMAMLTLEMCGQPYNKAAHNRALQAKLPNRNRSAIEFKHQNISAVLRDIGQPWTTDASAHPAAADAARYLGRTPQAGRRGVR